MENNKKNKVARKSIVLEEGGKIFDFKNKAFKRKKRNNGKNKTDTDE